MTTTPGVRTMEIGTTSEIKTTREIVDKWVRDINGPVALHLRQKLLPVEGIIEGQGAVLFPPTYAGGRGRESGYNIDELWDNRSVCTVDSVGSQANWMEPIFKEENFKSLVPQVEIQFGKDVRRSLLDVGHRLADAAVRNTDGIDDVRRAFEAWLKGDADPIAKLAPTSIVFGAWDSRECGAKLPRIVQAVIRAWDVKPLHRSVQYVPPVDYSELGVFAADDKEKAEGSTTSPLAERGYVHVPNTGPGGIVVRGPILRDVTINLVALRRIPSSSNPEKLRRYILGLSLVAATRGFDGFLRQGCLLTLDPNDKPAWQVVLRDGTRTPVALDESFALQYAKDAAEDFGVGKGRTLGFDNKKAQEDLKAAKDKKRRRGPKEANFAEAAATGDGA